jgi:hypothetical protein
MTFVSTTAIPEISRSERGTQNRVVAPSTETGRPDCLGYDYIGGRNQREKSRWREQRKREKLPTGTAEGNA